MTIIAIQGLRKAVSAAFRAGQRPRQGHHLAGHHQSQTQQHAQHTQHGQTGQFRQAHNHAASSRQSGGFFQAAWQTNGQSTFRHERARYTHWHESRHNAHRTWPKWGDRAQPLRSGSLDFEPHLQLKRSRPKWCKERQAPLFRARRTAEFNRWSLAFALLRAHVPLRHRHHPRNCPGNASTLKAERARHEEMSAPLRASFYTHRARQAACRRFLRARFSRSWRRLSSFAHFNPSRCWTRCKVAASEAHLNPVTLQSTTSQSASAAPITAANVPKYIDNSVERPLAVYRPPLASRETFRPPLASFRPFYLTPHHTAVIRFPHFPSTSSQTCCLSSLLHSAPFSTSAIRQGIHVPIAAAVKLGSLLKSGQALQFINVLFRLSVTLIPISWTRAKWLRKTQIAQLAAGAAVSPTSWLQTLFKYSIRASLALPFVLLAAVLVASLERTPITGRWRLVLLNRQEEAEVVEKVLTVGQTSTATLATSADVPEQRDWLSIMRAVLGEEETAPRTLLGGKVLDASDWRVPLVSSVLSRLEQGMPTLGDTYSEQTNLPLPPPLPRPVSASPRTQHYEQRNAVLVIDRPEANAFSFGFYGSADAAEPGVIIVFTGAIDEIMQGSIDPDNLAVQHVELPPTQDHEADPSWLRSFFGNIIGTPAQSQLRRQQQVVAISEQQEQALAVLLSHELAHLALSHTIESYAQSTLLWPQLEKLGWDMLRVFIYPITAILGPFVQDAISATVKAGISETGGILPALRSSCESRKLETEADLVALRLLANAGIDPRAAVDFWEERLAKEMLHSRDGGISHHATQTQPDRLHRHSAETEAFIHTHPPDVERVDAIRHELARWSMPTAR